MNRHRRASSLQRRRHAGLTTAKNARSALTGLLNKTENLQRDHRQDTRHQVENETADETENKETNKLTPCRILVSRCHSGPDRNVPGAAIRSGGGISEHDQAG